MVEMNAEHVSGAAIKVSGYERGDGVYVESYLRGADGRKIDDVEVDGHSIASPTLSKKKKKAVEPPSNLLDVDYRIRDYANENRTTDPQKLSEIAHDEDWRARGYAAANEHTPVAALVDLARDDDFRVVDSVAGNPATTPQILDELSHYGNRYIKEKIAEHKNTSTETLAHLVMARPKTSVLTGRTYLLTDPVLEKAVAKNHNANPMTLTALSSNDDVEVRRAVAANENTTPATLHKLASDSDLLIRQTLLDNKNLLPETRQKLLS